ncbi:unnamed protein product [Rangifer tarandus platyrhynchus]|uniref:Uncharacterized protein n=2 Tax=Rangifer tarandus platyrhynchus TaxID=3082113 RepID=A0ABN8Z3J7_RANTA|nr:unnamed protein product [Rangifer tarandus platyrhynchus]CAI9704589.1 unnamed protein product [Rangifer tarandus platyrhynchus]
MEGRSSQGRAARYGEGGGRGPGQRNENPEARRDRGLEARGWGAGGEWAEENPGSGRGAAAGLGPPQKSMGVPARGLSFAELGTRHRRWRRRRRRFGLRLGPPKGSRRRGGRGRVSAGLEAAGGVARGPERPGGRQRPARAQIRGLPGPAGRGPSPTRGAARQPLGAPPPARSEPPLISAPPSPAEHWGPQGSAGAEPPVPPRRRTAPPLRRRPFLFLLVPLLLPPEVPAP